MEYAANYRCICVDTAESGAEWPFGRVNPAFVRAQFVCARESCICAGLSTGQKYRNDRAQTESPDGSRPKKKIPIWFQTAQAKKRYEQGCSAFDTAETVADSKHRGSRYNWQWLKRSAGKQHETSGPYAQFWSINQNFACSAVDIHVQHDAYLATYTSASGMGSSWSFTIFVPKREKAALHVDRAKAAKIRVWGNFSPRKCTGEILCLLTYRQHQQVMIQHMPLASYNWWTREDQHTV